MVQLAVGLIILAAVQFAASVAMTKASNLRPVWSIALACVCVLLFAVVFATGGDRYANHQRMNPDAC